MTIDILRFRFSPRVSSGRALGALTFSAQQRPRQALTSETLSLVSSMHAWQSKSGWGSCLRGNSSRSGRVAVGNRLLISNNPVHRSLPGEVQLPNSEAMNLATSATTASRSESAIEVEVKQTADNMGKRLRGQAVAMSFVALSTPIPVSLTVRRSKENLPSIWSRTA
jgi:hypothetical protein